MQVIVHVLLRSKAQLEIRAANDNPSAGVGRSYGSPSATADDVIGEGGKAIPVDTIPSSTSSRSAGIRLRGSVLYVDAAGGICAEPGE